MSEKDLLNTFLAWHRGWWVQESEYLEKTVSKNHISLIGTAAFEYMFDRETVFSEFNRLMKVRKEGGTRPRDLDESLWEVLSSYIKDKMGYLFVEQAGKFDKIRYTCIFEFEDAVWKIVHLHVSTPDPSLVAGNEYRSKETMQKTLETWIENFDFNPLFSDNLKMGQLKNYLTQASNLLTETG